ncbi:RxLR effector protein [Phytophthora megakarya]|uniref:RxLR effector protein n=1 Tax=Phytophthora megakarya TaxID=4795 RepID=A0A225V4Y4_9STRA|nr:RxLR effector protein [Phytophthora megakarya]
MTTRTAAVVEPSNSRNIKVERRKVDNEQRTIVGLKTITSLLKSGKSKINDQAKIMSWKKNKKSSDQVFALLELDQMGENLFTNPKFKTWLKYVDKTVKVQTKSAMIATLTAKYGDDGLARLLQAAKNGRESKLADMLQTEQMWVWLTGTKGKSTDDIFHLLKLDEGVDKVLTNPNLQAWDDYIKFYNSKFDVKNPTTTFDSLKRFYGDEKMAKMLEAAKKEPTTRKIAMKLQTA